jgi:hypothetical protein
VLSNDGGDWGGIQALHSRVYVVTAQAHCPEPSGRVQPGSGTRYCVAASPDTTQTRATGSLARVYLSPVTTRGKATDSFRQRPRRMLTTSG